MAFRVTLKQTMGMRVIAGNNAALALILMLFVFISSNAKAHLLSAHPDRNQCVCAEIEGVWHYHFLERLSTHKFNKRQDTGFDTQEACMAQSVERLRWDVFTCP